MAGSWKRRLGTLTVGVLTATATTLGVASTASGAANGAAGDPGASRAARLAGPEAAGPTAPKPNPAATSKPSPAATSRTASPRPVRGAPVNPATQTLVQPDGTTFQALQHGDAQRNWWTTGGATIARAPDGAWRFATALDASGQPAAVGAQVTQGAAAPARARGLLPGKDSGIAQTDAAVPALGSVGVQKTLVILAQFANRPSVGTTPAQWNARFFGATDSVRSFYKVASSNKLDLPPATESSGTPNDGVVGWVSLPINHPNYYDQLDSRAWDVTARAIRAADPFVDFASYDTNANGTIEPAELHITVIAAGYEGSYGGSDACSPTVWGHRWAINTGAPVVDGKTVGSRGYTQFGESHCMATNPTAAHQATIGIMAHEIGHDLGWPDLYDTDGSSAGVGSWSLMASGSWGTKSGSRTNGDAPTLPDAWSRSVQSWVTPLELTATTTVSLPSVPTTDTVYRLLPNPNGPEYSPSGSGSGEYFLVENRQKAGLDTAIPGCGLVVYHVHENQRGNAIDADRLVDVVEADGLEGLNSAAYRGGPGDAWHGVSSHTVLTSSTTPSTRLNAGTATTAAMTATGGCAPTMSATLTGATTSPRPPNDAFAAAESLTGSAGTAVGSNVNATKESGEPDHANNLGGASIWYDWTAPSDGRLTLTTSGSGIDTLLGLYTGTAVSGLATVASNNDEAASAGILTSRIAAQPVNAGVTYRIAIDGVRVAGAPASGPTRLDLSFDAASPPPDVAAPVLSAFAFSPTSVDVNSGPRDVVVTARVTDATGARVPTMVLSSDTTSQTLGLGDLTRISGTATDGVYQRTVTVPATAAPGPWTVTLDPLQDTLGNSDSTFHHHPTKLTVTDNPPATVPGAPAGASAAAGNATATVSWSAPTSDGGSPITGYTVTSSPGGRACSTTGSLSCVVSGLTNATPYTFTVTATNAVGTSAPSIATAAVTPRSVFVGFTAVSPQRVLDTRTGLGAPKTPIGPGATITLTIPGLPTDTTAVVLNVTAVAPSTTSYLTVYPTGTTRPNASNLNYTAGQTIPNLVTVAVGPGGKVNLYNANGTLNALADLAGYYGP